MPLLLKPLISSQHYKNPKEIRVHTQQTIALGDGTREKEERWKRRAPC
jgi:hypothetical protein